MFDWIKQFIAKIKMQLIAFSVIKVSRHSDTYELTFMQHQDKQRFKPMDYQDWLRAISSPNFKGSLIINATLQKSYLISPGDLPNTIFCAKVSPEDFNNLIEKVTEPE